MSGQAAFDFETLAMYHEAPLFGLLIDQKEDIRRPQWIEMGTDTEWQIEEENHRGVAFIHPLSPDRFCIKLRDPRFTFKPVALIERGSKDGTLVAIAESRRKGLHVPEYKKVIMLPKKKLGCT